MVSYSTSSPSGIGQPFGGHASEVVSDVDCESAVAAKEKVMVSESNAAIYNFMLFILPPCEATFVASQECQVKYNL